MTKLTQCFEPQVNRLYEIRRFRKTVPDSSETLDQFHTGLRILSQSCTFADVDFQIFLQIVIGGKSSRLRKKARSDPSFTLQNMLLEGRRAEMSSYQNAEIQRPTHHACEEPTVNRWEEHATTGGSFSSSHSNMTSVREEVFELWKVQSFCSSLQWKTPKIPKTVTCYKYSPT